MKIGIQAIQRAGGRELRGGGFQRAVQALLWHWRGLDGAFDIALTLF